MRIRPAEPGDAEDLTELARASKSSWGYPDAWLREWGSELEFSAHYIVEHHVFVIEDAGRIVGTVAIEVGGGTAEIEHLWVSPTAQGRGVGRALVERARDTAREHGLNELSVTSDPNAVPFYERLGGVVVGEIDAPVGGVPRTLPVLSLRV